jgi:hypothetical protein
MVRYKMNLVEERTLDILIEMGESNIPLCNVNGVVSKKFRLKKKDVRLILKKLKEEGMIEIRKQEVKVLHP